MNEEIEKIKSRISKYMNDKEIELESQYFVLKSLLEDIWEEIKEEDEDTEDIDEELTDELDGDEQEEEQEEEKAAIKSNHMNKVKKSLQIKKS